MTRFMKKSFNKQINSILFFRVFWFAILIVACLLQVKTQEIDCQKVLEMYWPDIVGRVDVCFISTFTIIEQPGATISMHNDSITGLYLELPYRMFFLPDKVGENFPNLIAYYAEEGAISTLSRANFKGLTQLKWLDLWDNLITEIASDVFQDLVALERIDLGDESFNCIKSFFLNFLFTDYNRIQFMSGDVFEGLNNLISVRLLMNVCIDETFENETQIALMQETINKQCGTVKAHRKVCRPFVELP